MRHSFGFRAVLLCLLALAIPVWPGANASAQDSKAKSLPDIIEANGKAVGLVATLDSEGNYEEKFACFFVSPNGVLVTAYEPIAEAEALEVILPDGSKIRDVSVVNVDPRKDIAVLKVNAEGLPAVVMGDSDRTRLGESLVLLSRPLGTFIVANSGMVSALRDSKRGLRLHQVSVPVHSTGVGGPALNDRGEIVGMVSLYRLFNENLGFVIPINYIRGLLGDQPSMTFEQFVKVRKPFQPFDPALVEEKRLAIIDKVRVSSFQFRDQRVKWEQINEVTSALRSQLLTEMNAYGSSASEIFLADPFEVAEHRRLIASLYFNFSEIFAVPEAQPNTLIPMCNGLMSAAPPSVFETERQLYGKKGEAKGKISKVTVTYSIIDFMPVVMTGPGGMVNIQLATLLSRLTSTDEMPNLSVSISYLDPSDSKVKEAESIWSQDAYTFQWGDIKDRKIWDLQEKKRFWSQTLREKKKKTNKTT